ncbi:MAG TPA: DUF1957 domain-containing protein, partial [Myxococcota bacterium]|nr:DUF1957 domain-containing protein [Myxococcota bacterium]
MSARGYIGLVLHAHLPFVRHPEHERFLEEDWLYEAISECYLPLLDLLERLEDGRVPGCITLSLTPTLLSMLADELLMRRYLAHLERLLELSALEVRRTRTDGRFHPVARMYASRLKRTRRLFLERCRGDLLAGFRRLEGCGR